MIHRIKTKNQITSLYSLKSKELDQIFLGNLKNSTKLIKKVSLLLKGIQVKFKVKVFFSKSKDFVVKYAILISKKVGKAVLRNFIKRKIRNFLVDSLKKLDQPPTGTYIFLFMFKKE